MPQSENNEGLNSTDRGNFENSPNHLKEDPFYSPDNIARLKKILDDIESGRATLKEHDLIEDNDIDELNPIKNPFAKDLKTQ